MRKWITISLAAAAAVTLLAGCSGKKEAGTGGQSQAESSQAESSQTESSQAAETETETEEYVAKSSVKLGEYKGIPVTVAKVEVTDEDVETQIGQILNSRAAYEEVDRPAILQDRVNIDYKGLLDGEAFEGGTDEGFDLVLGSHSFIDGFEEGLIGARKGEKKELNLTFPDPYTNNEELSGKAVVFEVTVNSIEELKVPELNDEFVAKEFPEQGTVEKFREELKGEMVKAAQYQSDNQRDMDILTAIIDQSEIVCATDEVDEMYDTQLEAYTSQAQAYGVDLATMAMLSGTDEAGLKSQIREMARQAVKQRLVMDEIAKKENLTVTDEDREKLAGDVGMEDAAALIESFGQDDVDDTALYQKVLKFLADHAVITVEESTEGTGAAE